MSGMLEVGSGDESSGCEELGLVREIVSFLSEKKIEFEDVKMKGFTDYTLITVDRNNEYVKENSGFVFFDKVYGYLNEKVGGRCYRIWSNYKGSLRSNFYNMVDGDVVENVWLKFDDYKQ
jgi:hypothetical protein